MSDSSNQELLNDNPFDSGAFVRSLCKNKKIIISDYCEISLMKGWKDLVEELINKIGNYSISITQISDAHSQLDISFTVINNTRELFVWRAIENSRRKSRSVCALCGDNTYEFRQKKTGMFCKACDKKSSKRDGTGTWLDNY